MKNIYKRALSFILCLCMLVCFLPVMAFSVLAEEETQTETEEVKPDRTGEAVTIVNGEFTFTINKTVFDVGEPILVSGSGPNAKDWIGIYKVGGDASILWAFVDSIGDGVQFDLRTDYDRVEQSALANLPEGEYIVRLLADDSSHYSGEKATVKIRIGNPEQTTVTGDATKLSIDKYVYQAGETISVTSAHLASDSWVSMRAYGGFFSKTSYDWYWTSSNNSEGVRTFNETRGGEYIFHLFPDQATNWGAIVASVYLFVESDYAVTYQSRLPSGGDVTEPDTPDPENPGEGGGTTTDPDNPGEGGTTDPDNPGQGGDVGGDTGDDDDTTEFPGSQHIQADGSVKIVNGDYELYVNKTVYEVGEPILVSGKGSGTKDWIGIFRIQAGASIKYQYIENVGDGAIFDLTENYITGGDYNATTSSLPEGEYVIRLQENGSDYFEGHKALVRIKIGNPTTTVFGDSSLLSTDKTSYKVGEPIMVTPHMVEGYTDSWVGIYNFNGFNKGSSVAWEWVSTNGDGVAYDVTEGISLKEGIYLIRLLPYDTNDMTTQVAYTLVTVGEDTVASHNTPMVPATNVNVTNGTHSMTVNKTKFEVGEDILVTATGVGAKDWIGISFRDSREATIRWYYITEAGNGNPYNIKNASNIGGNLSAYKDIPAGLYTIYLVENDQYLKDTYTLSINIAVGDVEDTQNGVTSGGGTATSGEALPPESAEYTPSGNGYAGGTVTVNMPAEALSKYNIVMYWADENGPLQGYTAHAKAKVYSSIVTYTFSDSVIIPNGATRLLIYSENRATGELSEEFISIDLPQNSAIGDLGAPSTSFFAISDVHIGSTYGEKHFRLMLKDAIALYPNGAPIYISGDIADHGSASEYEQFMSIFNEVMAEAGADPTKYPLYLAIGNHDYPSAAGTFLQYATLPNGEHPSDTCYDFWLNGYHYIFLGGDNASGLEASFTEATLAWLDSKLAENRSKERPIFVFLHQPMYNTVSGSLPGEGWDGVTNEAELQAVISKYPEIVMFNGHTHWEMNSKGNIFEGTDALPIHAFNCASVSYLWTAFNITSGENLYGSQGYAVDVYDGRIVVRGRDFIDSEWIAAAQYSVEFVSECEHDYKPSSLEYPNGYGSQGIIASTCSKCGSTSIEACEPIIRALGYSVKESDGGGFGICAGYAVNHEMRALFESINGATTEIGVAMFNCDFINGESFFENGRIASEKAKLQVEIISDDYSTVNVYLSGITEELYDLDLALCAYVNVSKSGEQTKTGFIQATPSKSVSTITKNDGTLRTVSYNSLK